MSSKRPGWARFANRLVGCGVNARWPMADRQQTRRGVKTLGICIRGCCVWEGEGGEVRGGVFNSRPGGLTRGEGTSRKGGRHAMLCAGCEFQFFG